MPVFGSDFTPSGIGRAVCVFYKVKHILNVLFKLFTVNVKLPVAPSLAHETRVHNRHRSCSEIIAQAEVFIEADG